MSFDRFLKDSAQYRRFLGDGADRDYRAEYEVYTLTSVMIRENRAADPENVQDGVATLYFFPAISRCTDGNGNDSVFPRVKHGDICVIRAGTEDERVLRVAEAGYFGDGSDSLCHVRLKLI